MVEFADDWNAINTLTKNGAYPENRFYYRLLNFLSVDQLIDSIPAPPGVPDGLKYGTVTIGLHQEKKPVEFHGEFHLTVTKYGGPGSYHLFVKVLEPLPGKFYDLRAVGYSTTAHDRVNFEGSLVAAVEPTKWRTDSGTILAPDKWVWPD